jgi:glutathione S-transferase
MKLLGSVTSPFARKVRVVAEELGLGDRVTLVPTDTSDPALGVVNPLGKIPALILEDGEALYDSAVIVAYLDHLAGNRMIPATGPERWRVLRLEALADGIADAAVAAVMEKRRPAASRSADFLTLQRGKIVRGLDRLETEVARFDGLDAGMVATGVTLGYLDFRHPDLNWRTGRPRLAAWFDTFAQRPSMAGSAPPPA